MDLDDNKLNSIIHHLTSIITELKKIRLTNLALKIEEVREAILMAIREDNKNDSRNT